MHRITSLQHPIVKHLRRLREDRSYRKSESAFLLPGRAVISELEHPIRRLIVMEGVSTPSYSAKEIIQVPETVMKKITGLKSPDGLAAEVAMPQMEMPPSAKRIIVLDRISDPGNLGTLLRCALALGWDGAFLVDSCVDPYNERALRASKGASYRLPWVTGSCYNLSSYIQELNALLLVADINGLEAGQVNLDQPIALLMGSEGQGPSQQAKDTGTAITIPMTDKMESLNVATAGAILLHLLRGPNV